MPFSEKGAFLKLFHFQTLAVKAKPTRLESLDETWELGLNTYLLKKQDEHESCSRTSLAFLEEVSSFDSPEVLELFRNIISGNRKFPINPIQIPKV